MHWFLPAFAFVITFFVLVESSMRTPDVFLVRFWGTLAALFFIVSVVIAFYRIQDRRFLRDLPHSVQRPPLKNESRLGRYEVEVGLFLVRASFLTPFRHVDDPRRRADLIVACVLTFLLGWWSLPGLFRTPMILYRNVRGGLEVSASDVLTQLIELSA